MKAMFFQLFFALILALNVHDIEGRDLRPLDPAGPANVLFFITNDCPISNFYAPEIQRICGDYASKGVACELVYSDLTLDDAAIRKHHADYGYPESIPAV